MLEMSYILPFFCPVQAEEAVNYLIFTGSISLTPKWPITSQAVKVCKVHLPHRSVLYMGFSFYVPSLW